MKNLFPLIVFVFLLGFVTPKNLPAGRQAFAETSVHIENNGDGASSNVHVDNNVGQSTTCVNGNCSTTNNGNNSTTVCINGKCTASQDGTVDRQEGGASVHIQNNSNSSSVNSPAPTEEESQPRVYHPLAETITPLRQGSAGQAPKKDASHSASFGKTQDKHTQQKSASQPMSLEQMIDNIRKFFTELFSPNK